MNFILSFFFIYLRVDRSFDWRAPDWIVLLKVKLCSQGTNLLTHGVNVFITQKQELVHYICSLSLNNFEYTILFSSTFMIVRNYYNPKMRFGLARFIRHKQIRVSDTTAVSDWYPENRLSLRCLYQTRLS